MLLIGPLLLPSHSLDALLELFLHLVCVVMLNLLNCLGDIGTEEPAGPVWIELVKGILISTVP